MVISLANSHLLCNSPLYKANATHQWTLQKSEGSTDFGNCNNLNISIHKKITIKCFLKNKQNCVLGQGMFHWLMKPSFR